MKMLTVAIVCGPVACSINVLVYRINELYSQDANPLEKQFARGRF